MVSALPEQRLRRHGIFCGTEGSHQRKEGEMKQLSCGDQERCWMETRERKLPAELAVMKGSQLSSHLQEKKIIEKSAALLVSTDEE